MESRAVFCLSTVLLVALVGAAAEECFKGSGTKLFCYYGKATDVQNGCKCSHIILPADADVKAIDGIRTKFDSTKLLLTVNEFNEGLVNTLKSTKVDGLEINLKKLSSREDIADFVSTVRSKLGNDLYIALSVPAKPEILAKYYDFKTLSKSADVFLLQTAFLGASKNVTFHPSRLSGLWDVQNTDSVVDLVSGMGAPLSKLVVSAPVQAFKFTLQNDGHTAPGSPALEISTINRDELCQIMGGKDKWTLERDQDQAGPYIFREKQWIAFEDSISMDIKAKYSRVRGLAGLALKDVSLDGGSKCGDSLLHSALKGLSRQSRAPRGAVLHSLEREILETPAKRLDNVQLSPYRISRVIDVEGKVHVIRQDTRTEFECSRQGYFVHPRSCGRFYRCVKFDQLSDEFSVFEFDCPAGLAFDPTVEVCVWPGSLPHASACSGSSEIAPVPKQRFVCPSEPGYYADPENCRWFFACLDHGKSPLSAYEFRCPYGLVFDGERLLCEWPWLVPKCGSGAAAGIYTEEYEGRGGDYSLDLYDGLGSLKALRLGGLSGPLSQPISKTFSSFKKGDYQSLLLGTYQKDGANGFTALQGGNHLGLGQNLKVFNENAGAAFIGGSGSYDQSLNAAGAYSGSGASSSSYQNIQSGNGLSSGKFAINSGNFASQSGSSGSKSYSGSAGTYQSGASAFSGSSASAGSYQNSANSETNAFGSSSTSGNLKYDAHSGSQLVGVGLVSGGEVSGATVLSGNYRQGNAEGVAISHDQSELSGTRNAGVIINQGQSGLSGAGNGGVLISHGQSELSGAGLAVSGNYGLKTDVSSGNSAGYQINTNIGSQYSGDDSSSSSYVHSSNSGNSAGVVGSRGSYKFGSDSSSRNYQYSSTGAKFTNSESSAGSYQHSSSSGSESSQSDSSSGSYQYNNAGGNSQSGSSGGSYQHTILVGGNVVESGSSSGSYQYNSAGANQFAQSGSSSGSYQQSSSSGSEYSGSESNSGSYEYNSGITGGSSSSYQSSSSGAQLSGLSSGSLEGGLKLVGGSSVTVQQAGGLQQGGGLVVNHVQTGESAGNSFVSNGANYQSEGNGHFDVSSFNGNFGAKTYSDAESSSFQYNNHNSNSQDSQFVQTFGAAGVKSSDSAKINIVGGGYSGVGTIATNIASINNLGYTNVESSIPTVTAVPVPKTQFGVYKGGVVANLPNLQYKLEHPTTINQHLSTYKSPAINIKNVFLATTPATVVSVGYSYPKPSVAFIEGTTPKPNLRAYLPAAQKAYVQPLKPSGELKAAVVESYSYQKPAQFVTNGFEQQKLIYQQQPIKPAVLSTYTYKQPVVQTVAHQPAVSYNYQQSHVQNSGYKFEQPKLTEVNQGYQYEKPTVTFEEKTVSVQPAVTYQHVQKPVVIRKKLVQTKQEGYHYEKPTIAFEEKPVVQTYYQKPVVQQTIVQKVQPVVQQTIVQKVQPVVQQTVVQKVQPVKPAVVYQENYHYEQPKVVVQPAVTYQKQEGYHYEKPSVAFEEKQVVVQKTPAVSYQQVHHKVQPVVQQEVKIEQQEGYHYEKPTIAFEEKPVVQVQQKVVQPAVTYQEVKQEGYHYEKPKIAFEEKPVVVQQPAVTYQQINIQKPAVTYQQVHVQKPVQTVTYQQPAVTYQQEQKEHKVVEAYHYEKPKVVFEEKPVIHSYSYQKPAVVEQKQQVYVQPAVVEQKVVQPAVTYQHINIAQPKVQPVTYQQVHVQKEEGYHYEKPAVAFEEKPVVHTYSYQKPAVVQQKVVVEKPVVQQTIVQKVQPVKPAVVYQENYHYEQPKVVVQPTVTYQKQEGYHYEKPSVAFEEKQVVVQKTPAVSYQRVHHKVQPVVQQEVKIEQQEGYHYEKPKIAFEEKPVVQTYTNQKPAVVQQTVVQKVQPVVQKIQPVVQKIEPAVTYQHIKFHTPTVQKVEVNQEGYHYEKPVIGFEERPTYKQVLTQTVRPTVISSFSIQQPTQQTVITETKPVSTYTYHHQERKPVQTYLPAPTPTYLPAPTPTYLPVTPKQTYLPVTPKQTYVPVTPKQVYLPVTPKQTYLPVQKPKQVYLPQPTPEYLPIPQPTKEYLPVQPIVKQKKVITYEYPKPSVHTYSYESRQPVYEEPIVPKKAYVTGTQEGYNYPKPSIKFEEGTTPRPTYSSTVAAIVAKIEPVNLQEYHYYDSRFQSKAEAKAQSNVEHSFETNTFVQTPIVQTPIVQTPIIQTPVQQTVELYEAPKQSKPISRFEFSSFDAQYNQPAVVSTYEVPQQEYLPVSTTFRTPVRKVFRRPVTSTEAYVEVSTPSREYLPVTQDIVKISEPTREYLPVTTAKPSREYLPVTRKPSREYLPVTTRRPSKEYLPVTTRRPSKEYLPVTTRRPSKEYLPVTTAEPSKEYLPITPRKPNREYLPVTTRKPSREYLPVTTEPSREYLPVDKEIENYKNEEIFVKVTPKVYISSEKPSTEYLPVSSEQPSREYLPVTSEKPSIEYLPVTSEQPSREYLPVSSEAPSREYLPGREVESYIATRRPKVKVLKSKAIVKVNDFHPVLAAKLGAQCTCMSNTLRLRKKPSYEKTTRNQDLEEYVLDKTTRNSDLEEYVVDKTTRNGDVDEYVGDKTGVVVERYDAEEDEEVVRSTPATKKSRRPQSGKSIKEEIKSAVKEGVREALATKDFDRYGPGGLRSRDETLQGTVDCQRAGLFRHPKHCNKFYTCRWDESKKKFTLHVFNCPVHLTFDNNLGACNWPSQGPACVDNTLLPSD